MKDKRVMKRTQDNWYPNYPNGKVQLSLLRLRGCPDKRNWRVCVWGYDDFGLERDFNSLAEAQPIFEKLERLSVLNKQDCYDLQFRNA